MILFSLFHDRIKYQPAEGHIEYQSVNPTVDPSIHIYHQRIHLYRLLQNRLHHRPSNAKHAQRPQPALGEKVWQADKPSLAVRFVREDVSVHEQDAHGDPGGAQQRGGVGILETGDENGDGGLRAVLEVVMVCPLGAVELFGFGLHGIELIRG